jgi:predicted transcriptional regulator
MAGKPKQDPKLTISVTVRVWPNEAKALAKLARRQRLSRSQVLRQALEAYARTALAFDEYRALYPVE